MSLLIENIETLLEYSLTFDSVPSCDNFSTDKVSLPGGFLTYLTVEALSKRFIFIAFTWKPMSFAVRPPTWSN